MYLYGGDLLSSIGKVDRFLALPESRSEGVEGGVGGVARVAAVADVDIWLLAG